MTNVIYIDRRAGTNIISRLAFIALYLVFPSICLWGIFLLSNVLLIDMPNEIRHLGLTSRAVGVIAVLILGVLLCLYSFIALLYVLIFELPRQICHAYIADNYVSLTPLIGKKKHLKISDIKGVGERRRSFYWHAPFSFSMINRNTQCVLEVAGGSHWLLVSSLAETQKTNDLLLMYSKDLSDERLTQ